MLVAITRRVSPAIQECELTHLERVTIDHAVASRQHVAYEECLASLGCEVRSLPEEPDLPDSVFVEDAAVVLDGLAVITRPGAESRRPETAAIAEALRPYRRLVTIEAPGTLDGGDVLVAGRRVYVGRSRRTNQEGFRQFAAALEPEGYTVRPVSVAGCLHLKSAVGRVGEDRLLINRDWVPAESFPGASFIDVDPREPHAAGALLVGDTVVYPSAFPRTRTRLEEAGIRVAAVDLSELAKAESGVTCCSLVFVA